MVTATEIREKARESLKGKWGKGVLITIVYGLCIAILGSLGNLFKDGSIMSSILSLVATIIEIPLAFGLIISYIKLKRDEEVGAADFAKDGFSNFKRAWGIVGNTLLKMIVPFILEVVAIMLIAIALVAGAASVTGVISAGSFVVLLVLGVILAIVASVYSTIKGLLYTQSYYIAYDNPDMTTKEAVEKSAELMKGNRGNLFLLQLSFIGWAILSVCTFGIGFLWLGSYIQVSNLCFYEELKDKE